MCGCLVGDKEGSLCADFRWRSKELAGGRAPLRRMGDLPPERVLRLDPERLYASQSSGWFGQLVQRSDDGGKTWAPVGHDFAYVGEPGTHPWYDGTQRPWEFTRIWHLEPSLDDPATVYAGARTRRCSGALTDSGETWQEMVGLRGHLEPLRLPGSPGAGGLCLHTIIISSADTSTMFVAISARRRVPQH